MLKRSKLKWEVSSQCSDFWMHIYLFGFIRVDASMLHIIIFDEMDAIMRTRGSLNDNTGVSDSVVNQLLSKIDGVDSLNNILIIGMTNRKDMIDEAILRSVKQINICCRIATCIILVSFDLLFLIEYTQTWSFGTSY